MVRTLKVVYLSVCEVKRNQKVLLGSLDARIGNKRKFQKESAANPESISEL